MLALSKENPIEASSLVTEIVTKADEVSLWIRIVVRHLLEGMSYGHSIDELESRLGKALRLYVSCYQAKVSR